MVAPNIHQLVLMLVWLLTAMDSINAQIELPSNSPPLETASTTAAAAAAIANVNSTATAAVPVIPQLCDMCREGSRCIVDSKGQQSCFCEPDFKGKYCNEPVVEFPDTCRRNICENGGICAQSLRKTLCLCPENYVGANCSRVAIWVAIAMNLYLNGNPVAWEAQNKSEALLSEAACKKLITMNPLGPEPALSTSLVDCIFVDYEKRLVGRVDGVRVWVQLKYDPGSNPSLFTSSNVARHLEAAQEPPGMIGIDFEADDTITFNNVDMCQTNRHDCSPSATCTTTGIGYSCKCNNFYSDRGEPGKLLPGRDCYYSFISGFFVGTMIILPFVVAAWVCLFLCRRYQAQKAWINPVGDTDGIQLVSDAQYPKYNT